VSSEKNFSRRIISRKKGMNELCEGLYASCYPQSRRTRYAFMQLLFCWVGGNTLSLLNVSLVSFSSGSCCLCRAALIVQFSGQGTCIELPTKEAYDVYLRKLVCKLNINNVLIYVIHVICTWRWCKHKKLCLVPRTECALLRGSWLVCGRNGLAWCPWVRHLQDFSFSFA